MGRRLGETCQSFVCIVFSYCALLQVFASGKFQIDISTGLHYYHDLVILETITKLPRANRNLFI